MGAQTQFSWLTHDGRGTPITRERLERRLAWLLGLAFSVAVWSGVAVMIADLARFL